MREVKDIDQAGKVLLSAIDILNNRGWCQGGSGRRVDGSVCIAWAIQLAITENPCLNAEEVALYNNVRAKLDIGANIAIWNDFEGRTKEQVIEKLREAAFNGVSHEE